MNLRECYQVMKGDYDEIMNRIPNESSVARFLRMFRESTDFREMEKAICDKDYRKVFATSHNIKGMCANLGLKALQKSSSDICEAVRDGDPVVDLTVLLVKAEADYQAVMDGIDGLDSTL